MRADVAIRAPSGRPKQCGPYLRKCRARVAPCVHQANPRWYDSFPRGHRTNTIHTLHARREDPGDYGLVYIVLDLAYLVAHV